MSSKENCGSLVDYASMNGMANDVRHLNLLSNGYVIHTTLMDIRARDVIMVGAFGNGSLIGLLWAQSRDRKKYTIEILRTIVCTRHRMKGVAENMWTFLFAHVMKARSYCQFTIASVQCVLIQGTTWHSRFCRAAKIWENSDNHYASVYGTSLGGSTGPVLELSISENSNRRLKSSLVFADGQTLCENKSESEAEWSVFDNELESMQ